MERHNDPGARTRHALLGVGQVQRHRAPVREKPADGTVGHSSTETHAVMWTETALGGSIGYHILHLLGVEERKGPEGCGRTENSGHLS